jgi:hypothetical protein
MKAEAQNLFRPVDRLVRDGRPFASKLRGELGLRAVNKYSQFIETSSDDPSYPMTLSSVKSLASEDSIGCSRSPERLPDLSFPARRRIQLPLKRRAHGPLAGIVLIEIAECDVIVHAGANIPRRYLHVESAMKSLRRRGFVAGLLLEKLDSDRIGVDHPRRVIHHVQHGFPHLGFIGFASSPGTAREAEHQRGTQGKIFET